MLSLLIALPSFLALSLATGLIVMGVAPALVIMTQALVALVTGALDTMRHDDALLTHDLAVMDNDAMWRAFVKEEIKAMLDEVEEREIMAWFDAAVERVNAREIERKAEIKRAEDRAKAEQDIIDARNAGFWIVPCDVVESAMQAYCDDTSKRGAKVLYERLHLEQQAGLVAWRTHQDAEVAKFHLSQLLGFTGKRNQRFTHTQVTAA